MKSYSVDLRERILADCDGGMEIRQVAVKYRVSESWIRRLRQRRRENGEVAPRTRSNPPARWLAYATEIERFLAQRPDATLVELKTELQLPFSVQTLCRALQTLRLTFKKKSSARQSKTGRTSRSGDRSGGRGKPR
jgi:transposase